MKKIFSLGIFIALIMACSICVFATDISIDGSKVNFTDNYGYPYIDKANRTQVPLRVTMEAAGCTVSWNGPTKTALVSKGNTTVAVPIGEKNIYVNGQKKANDTAATIKNGRTYLPIRAVLEAFGSYVDWDFKNNTVIVKTNGVAPKTMTIHFINVGQGDATFIDFGDTEILIDAGTSAYGYSVSEYIRNYVQGNLDYVIATHPDSDHIGGLPKVMSQYSCGNIIESGDRSKNTTTFSNFLSSEQSEGCPVIFDSDMKLYLGDGAYLRVIETGDGYSDSNDNSVVVGIEYNSFSALFAADMSTEIENKNLSKFYDVDVLKLGHHGSYTATGTNFLSVVKPEVAIVSAGLGNSYGHPHQDTLQRLINRGTTVYGTEKSGTIVCTTKGYSYSFNTNNKLTVKDAGNYSSSSSSSGTTGTTGGSGNSGQTSGNTGSSGNVNKPVQNVSTSYIGNANSKIFHKSSITTNTPFSKWGEIFGSATLANAVLDRLLHYSEVYPSKDRHIV